MSSIRGEAVKLTESQIKDLDSRMRQAARDIYVRDPAKFRGMTGDERTLAAGIEAARAMQSAANNALKSKLWNERLRVTAQDDMKTMAQTSAKEGGTASGRYRNYPHVAAIIRMMEQTARQKGGAVAQLHGQLTELWGATQGKFKALPMLSDKNADNFMLAVFKEMRGEDSGVPSAKGISTGLSKILANQRERLNSYGANINELKNFVPQDHNGRLINAAGRDKWVNDTLDLVDKGTFIDADGNQLDDGAISDILGEMWRSITESGRNKKEYNEALAQIEGPLGSRSVMQRASSFSRQIHFKDSAAHEAYHERYSELKPVGLLLQHMQRVGEDIAMVERFGPDAKGNIKKLIDVAHRLDDEHANASTSGKPIDKTPGKRTVAGVGPTQLLEALTGHDDDYHSAVVDAARWLSSMHSATKLVRTFLRAVPQDMNTIINYSMELGNASLLPSVLAASTNGATRDALRKMGIGAGIIEQSLMTTGRRVKGLGDAVGQIGMDRLAASTMHMTGLQQWTNSASRSGQLIHGMHLAEVAGKEWGKLKQGSQQLLSEVGINAGNWDLVRQVPTIDIGGLKVPDIAGIERLNLPAAEHNEMTRLVQAFVWEGGNKITNERDLLARTAGGFGAVPGTSAQAVIQSLMLFRGVVSVITANMVRRWNRQATLGGKIGVMGSYVGGATLAGYTGNSLVNMSDGKNMQDPTDSRTWLAAFTTGGGAGFLGDMIAGGFGQVTQSQTGGGSSMWRLAGPTGSEIGDIFNITGGVYKAVTTGSPEAADRAAFQSVRFARNHIPLLNLWYTKAAVDHLFMNDMNEMVMPGYGQKMEGLAAKYGNQYWWTPSGEKTTPGFGQFKD